ncbi:MAG: hypothetical protein ACI9J3_002872 [Parvicellaceae bacterium]|jgi:hypothetical protein
MFQIGDQVNFLNEEGGGAIQAINGDMITVETEDGFDYEYPAKELLKQGTDAYEVSQDDVDDQARAEHNEKATDAFYKKFNHIDRMPKSDEMEVDLHIENLIQSHGSMTNFEIVEVQMANFRRSMNSAVNRNLRRVVFIHGVGAGVLREEIRAELRAYFHQYEYLDGSYEKYGAGATEVILK